MLTSKVEKVTFGLLLLLAFVGNLGVVEAARASQGVSIPVWASVVGAVLALILEVLLWSALLDQTGPSVGCSGQALSRASSTSPSRFTMTTVKKRPAETAISRRR